MPECHTCQHNGKKSPACIECAKKYPGHPKGEPGMASLYHHGKNHVSFDLVAGFIPAPKPTEPPTDYDATAAFIRALSGLGFIEREIIFSRLMGRTFPEITTRLNGSLAKRMTIQAVHAKSKKALTDPAIAHLFHEVVVKQQTRKAYRKHQQPEADTQADT